jgi:hypothetical protein
MLGCLQRNICTMFYESFTVVEYSSLRDIATEGSTRLGCYTFITGGVVRGLHLQGKAIQEV